MESCPAIRGCQAMVDGISNRTKGRISSEGRLKGPRRQFEMRKYHRNHYLEMYAKLQKMQLRGNDQCGGAVGEVLIPVFTRPRGHRRFVCSDDYREREPFGGEMLCKKKSGCAAGNDKAAVPASSFAVLTFRVGSFKMGASRLGSFD
jgi:hypothetical protein